MVPQMSHGSVPSEGPPKLFLLDGMALIYRAHFALIRSPRHASNGLCTSAVFGFCNTLLDILTREEPSHIAAAFDTPEPTHRHEAFAEYKAQREKMPEELAAQLPFVFRLLDAFRIATLRMPGYEADDVLGTVARRAESKAFQTFLVTPDKDFHQLVTDQTRIWKPGRRGDTSEILGVPEVLKRWQVARVSQVIDMLGLMGDSSDNIPGVPGVGEKTAQKLLKQFDSVENLLDHTAELKGRQKQLLESHAEQARLSKMLATILTDVPLERDLDAFRRQTPDPGALQSLFRELEFETLGQRLFGPAFTAKPSPPSGEAAGTQQTLFAEEVSEKSINDVPHDYRLVRTKQERSKLIEFLSRQPSFCLDLESTSLDPRRAVPLGLAFCVEPHTAWYVELPSERKAATGVLEEFRPLFENELTEKVGHNLKYDLTLLKWQGFELRGKLMDTMLAHALKEPELKHGLDFLAHLYLGYRPIPISDLIGPRGEDQKNMRDVPIEQVVEYACEDADITMQLSRILREEIEQQGMERVCYAVEFPLIPVLVDMEHEGIRLDAEALHAFSNHLAEEIADLRARIFAASGREFNIDSPKQLGEVLFDELALDAKPKKTATGQYSTREAELLRLAPRHEIVRDVLEYRNAVKLKSVYVDQLPQTVQPDTGRVHTTYSQSWTATGRMQSNHPNLQTIPIRKQRGREIRAAFVPRNDDYDLLSADYSQVELRIMAELSGDEAMQEAFREGIDIHTVTASKVYKVDLEEVTREMRDKAKTVNFGIIYGISAFGLQQRLNIPRKEAGELIANYFEKYPGVQAYIDRTIQFAREHGYVQTLSGRRRYLRDICSQNHSLRSAAERLAMNSPIQGTAADLLKLAMIQVYQQLQAGEFQTRMLLTVHDEIVFDMLRSERDRVMPVIEEAMKSALPMSVPLVVEMGVGQNWLEAH